MILKKLINEPIQTYIHIILEPVNTSRIILLEIFLFITTLKQKNKLNAIPYGIKKSKTIKAKLKKNQPSK